MGTTTLSLVIFLSICFYIANTATTSKQTRAIHPCSTVSCYYNSLCVLDSTTDEPICECPKRSECEGARNYPVCADGMTFKSACHAQIHMCRTQKWMTIQHVGPCGPQECGLTKSCSFYGRCENGVCKCEQCDDLINRRPTDLDVEPLRHIAVCGSDGVTYPSECHLRYQSCTSRMVISIVKKSTCHSIRKKAPKPRNAPIRSSVNHFTQWMKTFGHAKPVNKNHTATYIDFDLSEGSCPKYELRGCLPANHRRALHLGVYTLISKLRYLGSPVYRKRTYFGSNIRDVYLSRYNSSSFTKGTWVIGSTVGSGVGWFGVNDKSKEPEHITGLWFSTSGNPGSPWRPEPTVHGVCIDKEPDTFAKQECDLGEERSLLGTNWQSTTQGIPLYELRIARPFRDRYYKPNDKMIVEVFTNNRAKRFKAVFLSIETDEEQCGLPAIMTRTKFKFTIQCDGRIVSRRNKRMKKAVIFLKAPAKGCLTFRAFVKSVTDEVFYDNNTKGSLTPMYLTKKICHQGYKETLLVVPKKPVTPDRDLLN